MSSGRRDLDETDHRIIELLQTDGRITMSELGRRVNMSPVAVGERVKRLRETGVVTGFTAILDKDRLGLPIHAFILMDKLPHERRQEFAAYIASQPNVVANYRVMSGGRDAMLNVYCQNSNQLFEIQKRLQQFSTITTFLVEAKATKKTHTQI